MGGGGGGPSSSTTYTSNLPEYARPYYERLMDRTEAESNQPYTSYTGQRVAGFGEDSQAALNLVRGNVGAASGDLDRSRAALSSAVQAGQSAQSYRPVGVSADFQRTNFNPQRVAGSFGPSDFSSSYTGPGDYQERSFNADQVQAGRAGTGRFSAAAANEYMNPYLETVLDRQKDAAVRDFRIGQAGRDTQAIRAGAFGGSRAAIQQAMAEEDLSRRVGDIDAQGRQQAFSQAMAQFNQDQARDLQAQGMTLDQSIRAQLANQSANMQAQQLSEQSNQFGFGANEAGRQRAAELGLTAQQASDASRRFGSELDMRGQLANQSADLQAQGMTDASNRFATENNLRQQQINEAARQEAARLGLAGGQLSMSAGQAFGGLGSLTQQLANNDANALMRAGSMQDAMTQRGLDVAYDDFVNQRDFDRNQLLFYGSMLRGMPVNPQQEVRQFQNANPMNQFLGLGVAGLGAYNQYMR